MIKNHPRSHLIAMLIVSICLSVSHFAQAKSTAQNVKYVNLPSLHETPITIGGRFVRPGDFSEGSKIPAVVILHGSGGSSQREEAYQNALAKIGIASLAIDGWTARGLEIKERPETVMETLPDAYGARKWLMDRPEIDSTRIGIMGFSFGGVASMLASTNQYNQQHAHDGVGFKASLPVYPVCWIYNQVPGYTFKDLSGIPVQIITGGADEYDMNAQTCPALVSSLPKKDRKSVKAMVMPDVHHNFDKPGDNRKAPDSFSHRGKGGLVTFRHDAIAMEKSIQTTLHFFATHLKGK